MENSFEQMAKAGMDISVFEKLIVTGGTSLTDGYMDKLNDCYTKFCQKHVKF